MELQGCKKELDTEGQVGSIGEQEGCIQEQEGYMQEQEDCMQEDCIQELEGYMQEQEGCMQEQEGYTHKLGNRRKELLDLRVVKILDGYRRKEQMVEQNKTVDRNTVVLVAYCKTKQLLGYHIRHQHQECELGRHHHVRDRGHDARDVHVHRLQKKLKSVHAQN